MQLARGQVEAGVVQPRQAPRGAQRQAGRRAQRHLRGLRARLDSEIFGDFRWNEEFIEHRLRYYAFLNTGLTLYYNGKAFRSKNGLEDLLTEELGEAQSLYPIIYHRGERLELAFTHTHAYGETYFSFVNGQHTSDGGTHQSAFREGLPKGINEFAGKIFSGSDVRDGLVGAVAVKLQDPVFESQTKNKLGSTDVRSWIVPAVKDAIVLWLHQNPAAARTLIEKVEANEKLRKELQAVKKQARERAKKTAIRIPKLIDCKIHYGDKHKRADETSVFITEGDSAGGSLVQARDVDTQAIFTIKGKRVSFGGWTGSSSPSLSYLRPGRRTLQLTRNPSRSCRRCPPAGCAS